VQSFGLPPEAAGGPGFDAVGPGKWPPRHVLSVHGRAARRRGAGGAMRRGL
jgi:hypothetical protein